MRDMVTRNRYQALLAKAKKHMEETHWTHRPAAKELKRNRTHLSLVLGGRRISESLLRRVLSLPPRPLHPHNSTGPQPSKINAQTQAQSEAA